MLHGTKWVGYKILILAKTAKIYVDRQNEKSFPFGEDKLAKRRTGRTK